MLFREGFRRRHQRALVAALDCSQERIERDDRLPRADLALEQALHGLFVAEIEIDLDDGVLLLVRQREGKDLSIAGDQISRDTERRRLGTLLALTPPAQEAELENEQLLERETPARPLRLLTARGPVNRQEGVGAKGSVLALTDLGR
jgi:hypothetical protein